MTKHDIVERLYAIYRGRLTRNDVKHIVSSVFEDMVQEMTEGGEAKISRFGTFKVTDRHAKKGRNPRTGEAVMIEDRKVPKFKPSRYLQNMINGISVEGIDD